jgi:hypothetical protein
VELREARGLPERIMTDNGPEFTCRAMYQWAHAREVKLQFIEPGRWRFRVCGGINSLINHEAMHESQLIQGV